MARARYIPGALVEARSSKYGKGFGIIVKRTYNGYKSLGEIPRLREPAALVRGSLV